MMEFDEATIDETVLALRAAFGFDGRQAWKGADFDVMDRMHAQGLIEDPRNEAKSVWLTAEGLERGMSSPARLFGR